jgi:hypothetical protein
VSSLYYMKYGFQTLTVTVYISALIAPSVEHCIPLPSLPLHLYQMFSKPWETFLCFSFMPTHLLQADTKMVLVCS